jgi:hypothetical protein
VCLKQDKASWGAPKIGEKLVRSYPDVHTPAIGTVHPVLDRHGLVKRRMGRRNRAKGTPLSLPGQPNDLWCADYNGEFMLADRRYCYPPTITDFASHDLFTCEALATTKEAYTFPVFDAVFKEYGLPNAIRNDNGIPSQALMRLNMSYPSERYLRSRRPYTGLPNVDYPFHDRIATVTTCGRICFNRRKSISAPSSPARASASSRSVTKFGWSVLWIMISATSTTVGWNQSRTPSDQKCYLCLQNKIGCYFEPHGRQSPGQHRLTAFRSAV